MSIVTNIADAVANELNAGQFTVPFVAERRVLPEFELAELKKLKVSVVPRSLETAAESRSAVRYEARIDVGVQKKVGRDVDANVASLGTLADEIASFLANRRLADAPYATWTRIENDPVYVPEHLSERRVFTSVLTLTYRLLRTL